MTPSPESNGVTSFFRTGLSLFAALLIAISIPHPAASLQNSDADEQREQRILQFYELGLLSAFTANTSESIQEIVSDLTEEQDDAIFDTIILEAFREAQMEDVILNSIRRSFRNNDSNAESAISHLMNEDIQRLMGKLYNNQTDFDDPEVVDQFEDYISRVEVNPEPYQQRIDLVGDIINRSQTTRLTVQTLEDFLTIIIFTLNQTNPEDERLTDRQVNDLIISLRTNFRQLFDNIMLYVSLYSTRDFELELLEKHADFLATDAGRWFIRTYNNAVLNSFGEVSEHVASNLAEWALAQSAAEEQNEDTDTPSPSVPEQ
ncbi:MAG: hypothetical protein LAT84_11055 [Balneolia bacterium]|nr:hypothetical protein [Balneolia bacterium]